MNPSFGAYNAILAFILWGFFPIYWKQLKQLPALEIIGHRVLWSALGLYCINYFRGQMGTILTIAKNKHVLFYLCASAVMISANWLIYVWAVNSSHIVETGLGYFINPLVNVLLGIIFLREKLRPGQILAIALAGFGIVFLSTQGDHFPWIALSLATTFALYGLLRKMAPVESFIGLTIETSLVFLPAILFILTRPDISELMHSSLSTKLLLIGAGPATFIPLYLFANAARNLTLTSLGFFQYIAPSLQVLCGVFLYNEAFTRVHWISFGCVWLALAIYSLEAIYFKKFFH